MRVITGTAKGCKLIPLKGDTIRPTTDRIKEAIFSILFNRIYDANVLDLFSGTGALGIEALSRGALKCVFVDNNKSSLNVTRENLSKTRLIEKSQVYLMDSIAYLKQCKDKFDIIFIDPPYNMGYAQKALTLIDQSDIITETGVIVCESGTTDNFEDKYEFIKMGREYMYGNTKVTLYHSKKE